ncbi:MAG: Hsp20/alpha crystallin family protein [Lachnospiraceae bacterium]|nr:Hsp20/alpha crystallin family protein [Lachnospiraceae bacterium]
MFMPSIFRDNFVEDFLDDFNRPMRNAKAPVSGIMKTDVMENENGYEISIDLPGYKKEEVTAELKDGYMTISAESKKESEEKDQNGRFIRRERFVGSCSRTFYVGDAVTEEDIKAKFEDGVLKVSVPKKVVQPEIPEKKVISID